MRVLRVLAGTLVLGLTTAVCFALVNGAFASSPNDPDTAAALRPAAPTVTLAILARTGPHYARAGYFPSVVEVPAHSTVVVRIVDYDGPSSEPPGASVGVVRGTIGDLVTLQPMQGWDLADLGPSTRVGAFGPGRALAHTFTVPSLGINVPVAPHAVETFTIRTGAAGVYVWRCRAPCTDARSGAPSMDERGYMAGTLIVS